MALPVLGFALALRMNMNRVLPYISRSGASVIRLPPKFFSYQFAAAAVSGTSRWTWSYGQAAICADGPFAPTNSAAIIRQVRRKSDRIIGSKGNESTTGWGRAVALRRVRPEFR